MSGLLFQGVKGVADTTNQLRDDSVAPSLIPDPCSLLPAFDKLREECGVIAIHGLSLIHISLDVGQMLAVGCGDSGRLLAAMLKRV